MPTVSKPRKGASSKSKGLPAHKPWEALSINEKVYLPFRMDLMLKEGKLTEDEVKRYLQMLRSEDPEIEQLAVTILQNLRYGRSW